MTAVGVGFLGVGCASVLAVVVADGSQLVRAAHPTFAACLSGGVGDWVAAVVVRFLGGGCASVLAVVVADGLQSVRAAHPTFAAYSSVGVGDEAAALVVGFFGAGCAFVLAVVGAEGVVAGGGWSPAVGGTRARLLFFRPLIITREL